MDTREKFKHFSHLSLVHKIILIDFSFALVSAINLKFNYAYMGISTQYSPCYASAVLVIVYAFRLQDSFSTKAFGSARKTYLYVR